MSSEDQPSASPLPWIERAFSYVGAAEMPGVATAPVIARWLRRLRAWWSDDETPWCGVFVAAVLDEAGITERPAHWYRAREWAHWGIALDQPRYGCVVVYARKGGGHVGFLVGVTADGRLLTLGGNQGNKVSVAPFDRAPVLAFRWPTSHRRLLRKPSSEPLNIIGEPS